MAIASSTGWMSVGELAITPKDFARRSLLFQRFLQLGEQPDVLDGDDRLIGESFEKSDLLVRKGSYFGALNNNYTDGNVLAH